MHGLVLRPLLNGPDTPAAQALLAAALPFDHTECVAREKLFGDNGVRTGQTIGAFTPSGELLGLFSCAGRWIKLLVVAPDARRRGIGSALLAAARSTCEQSEGSGKPVRVVDHPGNYLTPGLDVRAEEAQAFFSARGFRLIAENQNLRVPLGDPSVAATQQVSLARIEEAERRLVQKGYATRRALATDVPELLTLVAKAFHPVWAVEVARALGPDMQPDRDVDPTLRHLPEGCSAHIARGPDGALVGFAAHDGNNRGLGWFGPTGTLPAHRGQGIGEQLLLRCLWDVMTWPRPDGGVIAWVGPVEFYARTCAARPDRRFMVFEEPRKP